MLELQPMKNCREIDSRHEITSCNSPSKGTMFIDFRYILFEEWLYKWFTEQDLTQFYLNRRYSVRTETNGLFQSCG
jgi:hypothetical protein